MLRSCYATTARFFNTGGRESDITWYFVQPGTPFLPVRSVINSLNWTDLKERIDHGDAGEIPGRPRTYSKGQRDVTQVANAYCGTAADWLGNGSPLSSPIATDQFGNPVCCGWGNFEVGNMSIGPVDLFWDSNFSSPGSYSVSLQVSSTTPFDFLEAWPSLAIGSPLQVDLYRHKPNGSGTLDLLSDFEILTFSGYAPQFCYSALIYPPSVPANTMQLDNFLTFTQVGSNPPSAIREFKGWVLSDATGTVLWYADLVAVGAFPMFTSDGDYVTLRVSPNGAFTYP